MHNYYACVDGRFLRKKLPGYRTGNAYLVALYERVAFAFPFVVS